MPRHPILPASDHYNPATRRFFQTPPQAPVKGGAKTVLKWLRDMTLDAAKYAPPAPLPAHTPDWTLFSRDDTARFCWFGHDTVLMRLGGQTLLFDPVFAEYASPVPPISRRFRPPVAPLSALPPIDTVLYSHNHYDHLDRITVRHFAAHSRTRFIVPLNLGMLLHRWGIPRNRITELDWWQHAETGSLKIHAVPARHSSGRSARDFNRTLCVGYVVQNGAEQIYFSGDSAYGVHFAEIGQRFGGFDLALLENGQYSENWPDNHMFPEQTAQAAADVRAQRFMPMHWGMFSLSAHAWDEPVRRSLPLVRAQGIKTLTPMLGEVFALDTQTHDWWQNIRQAA